MKKNKRGWAQVGLHVGFKVWSDILTDNPTSVNHYGVIESIDGDYIMVRENEIGYLAEKYLGEIWPV